MFITMLIRKPRSSETAAPPSDLSLAGASITYRNLCARRESLRKRRDELLAEQRELWETVPSARFAGGGRLNPAADSGEGGGPHESVADLLVDAPAQARSNSVAAYQATVAERLDVEAALEVLDQKIQQERIAASKIVVTAVKPHHDDLARRLASSMLAAAEAAAEYQQLLDDLGAEEVFHASLDVLPVSRLGDPRRYDSRWRDYLSEAVRAGYLAADAVPAHVSIASNPHPTRKARR